MKQSLVSVIVPCINRADFLIPTIESILQQDYPHIECIVVDGGSTDGTLEILRSYEHQIKWISEPDNGHADAINKGWQMSQGQILAWLNADDMWVVPNAVSQVAAYLQTNPDVDLVYGDCGAIDAEGNLIGMSHLREWNLEYAVEHCDHCIPQPAAFIRRHILEQVGWLNTAFYQKKDQELWLRIGVVGKIQYLPTLLAYARNVEGLSQDGKTAAPACVQVTKEFYKLPELPPHIKQ
ncbi:MAG: glycosyltransferase, partial [Deltaproteobacteria bacterium]|nr:glycosyltransferase [Deltaproteobacteria bacterium]